MVTSRALDAAQVGSVQRISRKSCAPVVPDCNDDSPFPPSDCTFCINLNDTELGSTAMLSSWRTEVASTVPAEALSATSTVVPPCAVRNAPSFRFIVPPIRACMARSFVSPPDKRHVYIFSPAHSPCPFQLYFLRPRSLLDRSLSPATSP